MDVFSRRIVGWAMATHLRTELVLEALNLALSQRRPAGVIHHSDQGSQYTSIAFGRRCEQAGVQPSMGSVGDCFDNAMCESFFATLEMRTTRPPPLQNPDRSAHGDLRVQRRLVQSPPPSFGTRLPFTNQLTKGFIKHSLPQAQHRPPKRGSSKLERFLKTAGLPP